LIINNFKKLHPVLHSKNVRSGVLF